MFPIHADYFREEKPVLLKPAPSSSVEIVRFTKKRTSRFVTDDAHLNPARDCKAEEIQDPGVGAGIFESRPVDITLDFSPCLLAARLPQVIPNAGFVGGQFGRHEAALEGDFMKDAIVADDRVIKVYADDHEALRRSDNRLARDAAVRP